MPITQANIDSAILPCNPQCATVLDMTVSTHYILLVLALITGLSMLLLYLKINSTLVKSSLALEKISDLFNTLE